MLNCMKAGEILPRVVITIFHRSVSAPLTIVVTAKNLRFLKYDLNVEVDDTMADMKEDWEAEFSEISFAYTNTRAVDQQKGRLGTDGPRGRQAGARSVAANDGPVRHEVAGLTRKGDHRAHEELPRRHRHDGRHRCGIPVRVLLQRCNETWRSPFKPYRTGQLTGLLSRSSALTGELGGWLSGLSRTVSNIYRASRGVGAFADAGAQKARAEALAEAIALAKDRYHCCDSCQNWVWRRMLRRARRPLPRLRQGRRATAQRRSPEGSLACPNCQTPSQGGRFCHECGFDMASTHKSCPSCSATMPRQARFCTDCGHGF